MSTALTATTFPGIRLMAGAMFAAILAAASLPAWALSPQQGLLVAGQGEVGAALDNAKVLLNASGVAPAVLVVGYGVDELPQYQPAIESLSQNGVLFFVCRHDLADPKSPPPPPVIVVTEQQRRIPGQAHIVKEIFNQCAN